MDKTTIIIILSVILAIVLYCIYRKNFKHPVVPCVCLVCGAPKVGKSLLCVKLALKDYKKRHLKWRVRRFFGKEEEEPLFYTNTAISFGNLKGKKPHKLDANIRAIELEHLLRLKRFNYASVVYIQESSFMADNQDVRSQERNAELSLFNKLYGHETKGGVLYYDTQSTFDNHYSIKRVVSNYFFVQKSLNFILFRVVYIREMINSDIGQNNFEDDIDTTTRKVLVPRWYYHKYDRYYFSYLTDKCPKRAKKPVLYKGGLVSFNPLYRELSVKKKGDLKNEELKKKYFKE